MNPRTPALLEQVVSIADEILRNEKPQFNGARLARIEELLAQVEQAKAWPEDDRRRRLIDDAACILLQCLRNFEREGPFGDDEMKMRWLSIAKMFAPWVRGDFAAALDRALRPAP